MNLAAVFHEPKSHFAYAYDANTVHLRLRTARGDVQSVTLIGGDPFSWKPTKENPEVWEWDRDAEFRLPMRQDYSTNLHDYWFIALPLATFRIRYAFILHSRGEQILYGSRGFYNLKTQSEFQHKSLLFFNFPYLNVEDTFRAPAWVKDTVWYQIFPERYARGGSSKWETAADEGVERFAGGNLQGILEHLDNIQALGITGLYLTPIFVSPSSHKYDTTDYYHVDPAFGNNEQLAELVHQAHRRGMRVMLDAVFNHCGWLHPFWQDVLRHGRKSRYFDCFYIDREPVINFELQDDELPRLTPELYGKLNFRTFGFEPRMPKWNTAHPLVREHLLGAVRFWMETCDVDGWRLDVSNEVSHDFWREFRKLVKGIKPDAYIMGENWDNSYPWLMGDQFDAVMNYELTYPIWNLLGTPETVDQIFDTGQFQHAINQLLVSYPKNVLEVMYNLLDSHDTARIMHICGGNLDKVQLAYVLLMTFTGSPSIYYGSELGLSGDGQHNRAPYPWNSAQNVDLQKFVQQLIAMRAAHASFRSVDIDWLNVNPETNTLLFKKSAGDEHVYAAINASSQPQIIDLPAQLANQAMTDLFRRETGLLPQKITLPGFGFRLWVGGK